MAGTRGTKTALLNLQVLNSLAIISTALCGRYTLNLGSSPDATLLSRSGACMHIHSTELQEAKSPLLLNQGSSARLALRI